MTRPQSIAFAVSACLFLVGVAGCGGGGEKSSAPRIQISAADKAEAKQKYDILCWTCHGKTGAGDGPASAPLDPKPRAFGDAAWQASVTDEHIEKIILKGGQAVGMSVLMPANPDLEGKPGVVAALREIVRSFKK